MLTSRYMIGLKNLSAIMQQIVSGAAPDKYNVEHLKGLGFKTSGDRAIIPLLKDLGFLTPDGTPTARYLAYRDPSKSRAVLGEALRDAYGDLFLINDNLSASDRAAIEGKFRSTTNSTERVAQCQAATFLGFLKMADISKQPSGAAKPDATGPDVPDAGDVPAKSTIVKSSGGLDLRYTIEMHLPPTKDIEVFNAIFKSLKQNLMD